MLVSVVLCLASIPARVVTVRVWKIVCLFCVLADVSLTPEQKLEQALATARALGPKLVPFSQPGEAHPTAKFQSVMEKRKLLWKKDKKVCQASCFCLD